MHNLLKYKNSFILHILAKKTHISGCKIVYLYTITTVTVHICTVIVACVFDILIIFQFGSLFSLSSSSKTNFETNSGFSLLPHILAPLLQTNTGQESINQIQTQYHPTIIDLPPQPISTFDNPNTKSNQK